MLTVSESAREALKKALDANKSDPEQGLRLTATGPDEIGLGIDVERPGDQIYEHEGTKVLMVNENILGIMGMLGEMSLDVHETEEGPRLMMETAVGGDVQEQAD